MIINDTYKCESTLWSEQGARTAKPLLYICISATIIHTLFWIQLITYPSVRQWSMQWLYAYLATDLLLLIRFISHFIYRSWSTCMPYFIRQMICYGEAIFDNYLNLLQSYILLALNICRYLQVAYNHNVYESNRNAILFSHVLIYFSPLFIHLIAIKFNWTTLENPPGNSCDLLPASLPIKIAYLLLSYVLPVTLTLTFLFLSLRYIHNTHGIRTQEIVDARHKYHRQIVIQSSVFYSFWIILWSPHILIFPFFYKNTLTGMIAQILNYLCITLDPIVIAALDVRFLQAWRSTGDRINNYIRRQRSIRVPVVITKRLSNENIQQNISIK